MDYIYFALKIIMVLFTLIVITIIYMGVANYVGEKLGLGEFFIYLWRKIRKK